MKGEMEERKREERIGGKQEFLLTIFQEELKEEDSRNKSREQKEGPVSP